MRDLAGADVVFVVLPSKETVDPALLHDVLNQHERARVVVVVVIGDGDGDGDALVRTLNTPAPKREEEVQMRGAPLLGALLAMASNVPPMPGDPTWDSFSARPKSQSLGPKEMAKMGKAARRAQAAHAQAPRLY